MDFGFPTWSSLKIARIRHNSVVLADIEKLQRR